MHTYKWVCLGRLFLSGWSDRFISCLRHWVRHIGKPGIFVFLCVSFNLSTQFRCILLFSHSGCEASIEVRAGVTQHVDQTTQTDVQRVGSNVQRWWWWWEGRGQDILANITKGKTRPHLVSTSVPGSIPSGSTPANLDVIIFECVCRVCVRVWVAPLAFVLFCIHCSLKSPRWVFL